MTTTTSVPADQTRADLEALHGSVNEGWTCLGDARDATTNLRYGKAAMIPEGSPGQMVYGCLFHQMYYLTENVPHRQMMQFTNSPGSARREAMMLALGFHSLSSMYLWNDVRTRTWQEVKDRVKDAIGRL
jgi:hypothetical protein